jgi:hypothetical protein
LRQLQLVDKNGEQSTGGTSGLGQGKLIFKVGGTETVLHIPLTLTTDNSSNGGRVGIGTTSPTAKLMVSGGTTLPLLITNTTTASNLVSIASTGAATFSGSVSKASGSFKIDHPLESKKDTHQLVHSFVESPQADLIYRGKLTLVNGKAQANIDEVSTMTEGTFEVLVEKTYNVLQQMKVDGI